MAKRKLKRFLKNLIVDEISLVDRPASGIGFRFVKAEDTTEVTPAELVRQALVAVDAAFAEAGHTPTVDERLEALGKALESLVDVVEPDQLNALCHEAIAAVQGDDEIEVDVDQLAADVVDAVTSDGDD